MGLKEKMTAQQDIRAPFMVKLLSSSKENESKKHKIYV